MSKCANDSDSDFEDLLECSVCLDTCRIPIQQCKNGHNVCNSHLRQLGGVCPVCRVAYSDGSVRNLLAEKLILKKRRKSELKKVKLNGVTTRSRSSMSASTANNQPQLVRCKHFNGGGCQFTDSKEITTRHELTCDYRLISCCLETNSCFNAQIPFRDYINHLKTHHKVKTVQGSTYLQMYFVNACGKLVRNGSSSLFIMETFSQQFLVTAKETDGRIFVWVSIHGPPADGLKFVADIEFQDPHSDDNDDDDEGDPHNIYVPGRIRGTTRLTLSEMQRLLLERYIWSMDAEEVLDRLEIKSFFGGKYVKKCWSVIASITRASTPSERHLPNSSTLSPNLIQNLERPRSYPLRRTIDSGSTRAALRENSSITTISQTPQTVSLHSSLLRTPVIRNRNAVPSPAPTTVSSLIGRETVVLPVSDLIQRIRTITEGCYRYLPQGPLQGNIGSQRSPVANTGLTALMLPVRRPMSDFARDFYATSEMGAEGILHSELDSDVEMGTSPVVTTSIVYPSSSGISTRNAGNAVNGGTARVLSRPLPNPTLQITG